MNTEKAQSGGVGFCGLLAILFIALKLTGVIDWSWWWVTAPLWGGIAALIGFMLAALVIFGVVWCILHVIQKCRGR